MGWFQKKEQADLDAAVIAHGSSTAHLAGHIDSDRLQCTKELEYILSTADKQTKGVVLKLYLENFKRLNDVYGHDYCENLLEQIIAYLTKKTGRRVYRYIGVEFIIILDGLTQGQASALSEEILYQFDPAWRVNDTDCLCSAQIGLCSYANIDITVDGMLKCLDLAISKAVETGPNQWVMYDSNLHNQFLRRQAIAMYLKTAITNNEIEVRYRPTYHLKKKRFTRAEYYMRIFIKGIGLIGAAEFIPIAEDSGQIRSVEYFALEQVGACIAQLIAAGKEFDSISLPISSVLFLQDDFLDKIKEIKNKYQIPTGKLALEINESALTTAYLNINVMLQELSDIGIELILNDFGSGYSSITSMLELPVHTLKLERLFIWQLETNEKSAFIIEGLIHIAKRLNLDMIAEGVETDHQANALESYGCDYQQGFFYSPTVEKEVLINIIDSTLEESRQTLNEEKEKMKK